MQSPLAMCGSTKPVLALSFPTKFCSSCRRLHFFCSTASRNVRFHQIALVLLLLKCQGEEESRTNSTSFLLPTVPRRPALLFHRSHCNSLSMGHLNLPDTCPKHITTACHASAKMWAGRAGCGIFQLMCMAKARVDCCGPQSDQAPQILEEFTLLSHI